MLKNKFCYDYPRPAVSADCVIIDKHSNEILLIHRNNEPFRAMWAFPGGFIEENETVEEGVARELDEETGLNNLPLKLLGVYSKPGRDPRGRVITLAYLAIVDKNTLHPVAGDDAGCVYWFSLNNLPPLAFDHKDILEEALLSIKEIF